MVKQWESGSIGGYEAVALSLPLFTEDGDPCPFWGKTSPESDRDLLNNCLFYRVAWRDPYWKLWNTSDGD